jgi:hypothetical protein
MLTNTDTETALGSLDQAKRKMEQAFHEVETDPMNLNNLMEFICQVSNRIELLDTITRHVVTEGCTHCDQQDETGDSDPTSG